MKNIVLTRIDDRLLHGQVVVSWIPYLQADEVVIVDDEYAADEFMALLIKNAAPDNVRVHIFTAEEAAAYLKREDEGTRILVLVRNVVYLKELTESGVKLGRINIGNSGGGAGREKYHNTVHFSHEELSIMKDIALNAEVEIRMLPKDKALAFS